MLGAMALARETNDTILVPAAAAPPGRGAGGHGQQRRRRQRHAGGSGATTGGNSGGGAPGSEACKSGGGGEECQDGGGANATQTLRAWGEAFGDRFSWSLCPPAVAHADNQVVAATYAELYAAAPPGRRNETWLAATKAQLRAEMAAPVPGSSWWGAVGSREGGGAGAARALACHGAARTPPAAPTPPPRPRTAGIGWTPFLWP